MKKKVISIFLIGFISVITIIIPITLNMKKNKTYESIVVVPNIDTYKTLTLEDIAENKIN